MNMDEEEIIYYLNITDVQEVANQELGRSLSSKEIEAITDAIAENINWYDAIERAIAKIITSNVGQ